MIEHRCSLSLTEYGWRHERQPFYTGHALPESPGADRLWWCECGQMLCRSKSGVLDAGNEHRRELWRTGQWFWERAKPVDGCLIWTAKVDKGYGRVRIDGRSHAAHRAAWELVNGPVAAGLQVDHLCGVTLCVNPEHLEPVTQYENWRRSAAPSAVMAGQSVCRNGHVYDEANTYWNPANGYRECRGCRRASAQRRQAKARSGQ